MACARRALVARNLSNVTCDTDSDCTTPGYPWCYTVSSITLKNTDGTKSCCNLKVNF